MNDISKSNGSTEKDKLTYDEREYLQKLFFSHYEKIDKKLHEELLILSKYKGELAKNYQQCGAYQSILAGCMRDIQNQQEKIFWVVADLIKAITGKYPQYEDRIDAVEEKNPWK